MLTRRALLTGGAVGGVAVGRVGADPRAIADDSAMQSSARSRDTDQDLVKAVEQIRDLLRDAGGANPPELATIRSLQRDFLKGRGKYPDFIEVGVDVWDAVVNWHIRTRQQPQITRIGDGRYAMAVFQSNLVLRPDATNSYIGQPFDGK